MKNKKEMIIFFLTFLSFLILRLYMFSFVFGKRGLQFVDPDSYYHLRRILYSFENFPNMLIFDPFVSYPTGDFVPWPPFFDFLTATISLPFSNPIFLICSINLIFAIAVFLMIYLVQRKKGLTNFVLSAIIIIFSYSIIKIGMFKSIDHHIVEVFVVTAFYVIYLFKPFKPKIRSIVITLVVAISFFNWLGAPLYYVPVFILTFWEAFNGKCDEKTFLDLGIAFTVTGILIFIYFSITEHNVHPYSFKYLSEFQRDICLALGLLFFAVFVKVKKNFSVIVFVILIFIIIFVFHNVIFEIFRGFNYLEKTNESKLMELVSESEPLLSFNPNFFADKLFRSLFSLTPFYLLYPFIAIKVIKKNHDIKLLLVSFYFFLLTLFQLRMAIFFVPFYSLLFGDYFAVYFRKLNLVVLTFIILTISVLFGKIDLYGIHFYPEPDVMKTMNFLQYKTPLSYEFDKGNTPYGIMSGWHLGHYIITLGNRPAAAHNFIAIAQKNKELEMIKCIFAKSEEEVLKVLDDNLTPFMVVSNVENIMVTGWKFISDKENPYVTLKNKIFEINKEKAKELFIYNLLFDMPANRLRLVFESSNGSMDEKTIFVYEKVKGTEFISDENGIFEVTLQTPYREIILKYEGTSYGYKYIFKIPYSTEQMYDVYAKSIIFKGKKEKKINISEKDVLFGARYNL